MNQIKEAPVAVLACYMQAALRCIRTVLISIGITMLWIGRILFALLVSCLILLKIIRDLYLLYRSSNKVIIIFVKTVQLESRRGTLGSASSNELVLPRRTKLLAHEDDLFETQCISVSERETNRSQFVIGRRVTRQSAPWKTDIVGL